MLRPEAAGKRVPRHEMAKAKTQYGILLQEDLTVALIGSQQIPKALSVTVTMHLVPLVGRANAIETGTMSITGTVVCVQAHLQLQGAREGIMTAVLVGSGTEGVTGVERGVGKKGTGIKVT